MFPPLNFCVKASHELSKVWFIFLHMFDDEIFRFNARICGEDGEVLAACLLTNWTVSSTQGCEGEMGLA